MLVQRLEETWSTQLLFSTLFNIFHSSFFYSIFGISEAGKRGSSHSCWERFAVRDLSDLVCIQGGGFSEVWGSASLISRISSMRRPSRPTTVGGSYAGTCTRIALRYPWRPAGCLSPRLYHIIKMIDLSWMLLNLDQSKQSVKSLEDANFIFLF